MAAWPPGRPGSFQACPCPPHPGLGVQGMDHAHFYARQTNLDVVALRIASVYGPLYYSVRDPIGRLCHAAARNTEPDFSDRPDGRIFADDQADSTYVKDAARGIGARARRGDPPLPGLQHQLAGHLQPRRLRGCARDRVRPPVRGAQTRADARSPRPIRPRICHASWSTWATSPSTRWGQGSRPTSNGCGDTRSSSEPGEIGRTGWPTRRNEPSGATARTIASGEFLA